MSFKNPLRFHPEVRTWKRMPSIYVDLKFSSQPLFHTTHYLGSWVLGIPCQKGPPLPYVPKILLVLYLPEVLLGVFLKDHLSDHAISLLKALQRPQGSPDKIVIPGNSLQATCSLTFGYFSLSTSGRAGPVPAFFTVVSLCPALCLEYHGHQINTH